MGATKRICEKMLLHYSHTYSKTTYSTVRFGNVLGSSGSVVPKFLRQIEKIRTSLSHTKISQDISCLYPKHLALFYRLHVNACQGVSTCWI